MDMLQILDAMYGIRPDLKVPKGFFSNSNKPNCVYLASCTENEFLYVSESLFLVAGYSSKMLLNEGLNWWFSLIHPEDIDHMLSTIFQHCFLEALNKRLNKPFSSEYRLKKSSGDWIWISETKCVVSVTNEGKNELILGILEEVSEIKRNEEIQIKQLLKDEWKSNPLLKAALPFINSEQKKNVNFLSAQKQNILRKGVIMPTKRELEILELIGEGYSTKQIAQKLYISINTVETHRRHLLEKMKVKNSMELIKHTTDLFLRKAV